MPVNQIARADLTRVVGAEGSLSLLDKRLLRYAGQHMTLEQMSEKLGGVLTAAQCGTRVREILKSYDWASQIERRALILMDFEELKQILQDRIRREGGAIQDADGRVMYSFGDPRWAANLTNVLKEMSKIIATEQKQVDADRTMLRREQARVMMQAVELALVTTLRLLRQDYPEVSELQARNALEQAIPIAIQRVENAMDPEDRETGF